MNASISFDWGYAMPIIAKIKIDKLSEIIFLIINFFRSKKEFEITSIDVNGYLFYKYRGTLFVRKGVSNTFFPKEMHLLKNYLDYIINYLTNENKMAWTRTVIVLEITIDILTKDSKNIGIILEVSNEEIDNYGQIIVRPLINEDAQNNEENEPIEGTSSNYPRDVMDIDELIVREDLQKISPIDIFQILTLKEVNELISQLKKKGAYAKVADESELE